MPFTLVVSSGKHFLTRKRIKNELMPNLSQSAKTHLSITLSGK